MVKEIVKIRGVREFKKKMGENQFEGERRREN